MLGIHFHHALDTAPVLADFTNMIFRTLSGRLSAQCAATSFWCCVFTTFFFRDPWSMRATSWKILRVAVRQSLDLNVTSSSLCHCVFSCFQKPEESHWCSGSSASTATSFRKSLNVSLIEVWKLGKDTWSGYKQLAPSTGKLECLWVVELYSWLLDFWPIEARRQSSNGAISWAICFATSNLVGVSSNESSFQNSNAQPVQQRGNPKLWSDKSKDATQSWAPRASTKALRCTEVDPTFAFRSATPLWSSIGQLQQNRRLNLVLPRSQRRPKLCPQACSEATQLTTYACTHDKRVQSHFHVTCSWFLGCSWVFLMICLVHKLPNACLVGFKPLFHGSTFSEEQVWKWGGASWHASIVTNHLSPLLSFYPTKRTCLCSDLWLHWHADHVNSRTRVYVT